MGAAWLSISICMRNLSDIFQRRNTLFFQVFLNPVYNILEGFITCQLKFCPFFE